MFPETIVLPAFDYRLVLFMLMMILATYAQDVVMINSIDGRDVLSGIFYANVIGAQARFMPSQDADAISMASRVGSGHDVLLIQSRAPQSNLLESQIRERNNTLELFVSSDGGATNLELATRSKERGVAGFVIVDSAFSDGALSVLPYAASHRYFVILTDKGNVAQVKDIVAGHRLVIYGFVDSDVLSALEPLSPERIGAGEDRFEDNIAIVKKMMQEQAGSRVILADGSFIEDGMIHGDAPILLIGRIVPAPTYSFMKNEVASGRLQAAVLIGNDLMTPVYDMRERMRKEALTSGSNGNFSIFVKFGQAIPSSDSGVMSLDVFRLPSYRPRLNVTDAVYDQNSKKLLVSVRNIGEAPAYFVQDVGLKVDGRDFGALGTTATSNGSAGSVRAPSLIERGASIVSEYPLDLSDISEGAVSASILTRYGTSRRSFEEFSSGEFQLARIDYADTTNVTIQSIRYDKDKQNILVSMRNNGDKNAYVFSRLSVVLAGSPTNVTSPGIREIGPGEVMVEEFPLVLESADIEANQRVTLLLDFGGRPAFLLRHASYSLPLGSGNESLSIFVAPAILFASLFIIYTFLKKNEDESERPDYLYDIAIPTRDEPASAGIAKALPDMSKTIGKKKPKKPKKLVRPGI